MRTIKKNWELAFWTTSLVLLVGAILIFQIQCNGGGGGGGGSSGGCTNTCSTSGIKQCSGSGYQTCGNYDSDSCLEWSSITPCGANETCSNGVCSSPCIDKDGDKYGTGCALGPDCDDNDPTIHPGVPENCSDSKDNNCDGIIDQMGVDNDGDGWDACDDCNDNDPLTYPGAPELCPDVDGGGINNDCDPLGNLICDCSGAGCVDSDHDEYASTGSGGTDCNDNNASINPNAVEVCPPSGKNIDENCDGSVICDGGLVDADGDNYGAKPLGTDCDDTDPNTYPGAPELCDSKDNNCNGTITDEGSPEKCNGIDDDCDTLIDELWPNKGSTCGNCGIYVCNATQDGLACNGEGVCSVAQTQNQNCGNCNLGTQTRSCNASCQWNAWGACSGGGICSPGQTDTQSCGQCSGTQSRTCTSSCTWGSWGSCTCNSQTGYQSCGDCGQQSRTCNTASGCNWSSWGSCACSTTSTSQSCGCGGHGTENRTCNQSNSCLWGSWGTCSGDYDNTPPGAPSLTSPTMGQEFIMTPSNYPNITFQWSQPSDNCGLASSCRYHFMFTQDTSSWTVYRCVDSTSVTYQWPSGLWYWKIRAYDLAGNYVDSSVNGLVVKVRFVDEGFEGSFPPANWYSGDDDAGNGLDYWSDSGNRSYAGSYSAWCANVGTQGDNDCGVSGQNNYTVHYYDDYMQAWLDRRNLNFSGYTHVSVDFYYWLKSENNADFFKVYCKNTSSGTWYTIFQQSGTYNWTHETADLSGCAAGQSNVIVQFKFESDLSIHCNEGVYVDLIRIDAW